MVKFSRELEAQLIPEWKDAFVNYRQLKKHVKKIKISLHSRLNSDTAAEGDKDLHSFGISIFDSFRVLAAGLSSASLRGHRDLPVPVYTSPPFQNDFTQALSVEHSSIRQSI